MATQREIRAPTSPAHSGEPFPRRLSAADELMWRLESDPVLRSPILVLALLDRAPNDDRIRSTLTTWQRAFPRLRQRVATGCRLRGGYRWVDCDDASLSFHVRRARAPGPADLGAVLALVEPTVAAAFDVARPLWELTVVEGLAGGGAALVLRFHHSITDGVGGIELAGELFDRNRRGPPQDAGTGGSTAADGVPGAGPVVAATRHLGGAFAVGLQPARHPMATLDGVRRFGTSLVRALAPGDPGSPELAGRGLDRYLDVLEVPLAGLRQAADQVGGTLNDVFLAAVGGALRQYHERVGRPLSVLQCTMPISLRAEGDNRGGNRFAPAHFALPVDDPDPVARARIAGALTRQWRAEPALSWTEQVATVLDFLPRPLTTRVLGGMLKRPDVDVVNVPGLRRPAYFAGSHVERLWAFAPPTGAAMSVTLLSHVDTCGIGLSCDRDAVTRPELVRTCLESALEEAVRGTAGPVRRSA
jgi:WS/DGAT/MGAT family acyltransferase